PDDPMIELEVGGELPGATVTDKRVPVRAIVHCGAGLALRLVDSGEPLEPIAVTSDPFVYETTIETKPEGESFLRAEVMVDDRPRTVTYHVFLQRGDAASDEGDSEGEASGCGCRIGASSNVG